MNYKQGIVEGLNKSTIYYRNRLENIMGKLITLKITKGNDSFIAGQEEAIQKIMLLVDKELELLDKKIINHE